MFGIYEGFIGYRPHRRLELFSNADNEADFKKALLTKPDDWYYRTANIVYNRNSQGHRSKEIKDIDLENYFLVTGCSITEGIGLELEKTYPYLLSKMYNCDYHNLAIAGSGIDAMMHNLIIWFSKVKKKPKFVVIQVPTLARYITIDSEQNPYTTSDHHLHIVPNTITTDSREAVNFILAGESVQFFESRFRYAQIQYNNLIDCPVVEIHTEILITLANQITLEPEDQARDYHPGINTHYALANKVANCLQTNYNIV
jgi:hypothetical protein